ncbi:conjugative transposon protein TraM [Flagellimonas lutimaris]|uniref:Conjugative transposon protein TraM n=1 Tax=Flagellimonas lutimaris TaxID=475082 RepID=A0A3A1N7V9_9FLAO|nr:conjugative transposon protein TraM [Allomuricauda lutimaris]RIV31508.1 conjugative transposon protein TraM [Allomuricauda lutimaris]
MKLQKNKIVFVLVMVCVVLFIAVYSIMTFGRDKEPELDPERMPIPDLEDYQVDFSTKLEAVEAIKKETETNVPSIYPEHMVDEKGYFNPDYMEYEKHRIIDSVYQSKTFYDRGVRKGRKDSLQAIDRAVDIEQDGDDMEVVKSEQPQELGLSHQLFFDSRPQLLFEQVASAHVDGSQIVADGHRLSLRLDSDIQIHGNHFSKGLRMYGFIKIRPNRILLEIFRIGAHKVTLKAHDFQDGLEGIYLVNRLRGEVKESVLDATLGDINLPGIPQVGSVKRIFQRNNRSIKVEIPHNYKLILKP